MREQEEVRRVWGALESLCSFSVCRPRVTCLTHTAQRAPPWAFTLLHVCSHHPRSTNERLLRPHLRNRGAPTPRGAGADRARPPGSLPHSAARHARRSDPDAAAKAPTPRRFQTELRMHAGEFGPRRTPIRQGGRDGRTHSPPWVPAAALRRARPPPSDVGRAPVTITKV